MKLPCSVTRDLLPLYREKMVESETAELIRDHLQSCPGCRQSLSEITEDAATPSEAAQPLKALKREIRTRRWFTAVIASLCVFVAVYACFYQADSLKPVSWEEGLIEVQGIERRPYQEVFQHAASSTGSQEPIEVLVLRVDSRLQGFQHSVFQEDETGTSTLLLRAWSSRPLQSDAARTYSEQMISPVPDSVVYQCDGQQHRLWGESGSGGMEDLPRLALAYYAILAAITALLSGIVWLILRKRPASRVLRQIFFAPVSYLAAHLLIKGTHTASFFMQRDFLSIVLIATALYVVLTLSWQLWLRRRKER